MTNARELKATHERIEQFQRWLVQMRQTARSEEFEALANPGGVDSACDATPRDARTSAGVKELSFQELVAS